ARLRDHRGLTNINETTPRVMIGCSRRDPLHGLRKGVYSPAAPFVGAFFMLKIIAIVIVVAIVAVLGFAATRPDTFR
ncbi:hypothetical protein K4H02_28590, partial [Mycobacterium tuberculosis]|nr:hypothetical protein [Mycobacterium tuberculosis]